MNPAVAEGQFDDAVETQTSHPVDLRSGYTYIDSPDSEDLDWPDTPEEDSDDLDDTYDDNRVEDEDWEIAEKGISKRLCEQS